MSGTDIVTVGEPLPKLARVSARDRYQVSVTWKAGARAGERGVIDLAPVILSYKMFRPLRANRALFRSVHLTVDGSAIAWGKDDAIDMAATTLERLADEKMTAADFKAFLKRHRLTLDAAAAQLGISRRLAAYYAEGRPIPRYIALACAGLEGRIEVGMERAGA
jgi:hypothetical protein